MILLERSLFQSDYKQEIRSGTPEVKHSMSSLSLEISAKFYFLLQQFVVCQVLLQLSLPEHHCLSLLRPKIQNA